MKDLLSKEHCYYKINAHPPTPPTQFYKKILILPFCDFSKTPPINTVRSSHYEMDVIRVVPSFS